MIGLPSLVVERLGDWHGLGHALICGGCEEKTTHISAEIARTMRRLETIAIVEYRRIDIALFDPVLTAPLAINQAQLVPEVAIECKFNYYSQPGDIAERSATALEQLRGYGGLSKWLLYVTAAFGIMNTAGELTDAGYDEPGSGYLMKPRNRLYNKVPTEEEHALGTAFLIQSGLDDRCRIADSAHQRVMIHIGDGFNLDGNIVVMLVEVDF